jgi:hypothetical protein
MAVPQGMKKERAEVEGERSVIKSGESGEENVWEWENWEAWGATGLGNRRRARIVV